MTIEEDVVVTEYNVSMHCNACERTVAKTISKIEGVEKFTTDIKNHRVVVTGKFDPQKVMKKLKKKTNKKVEIVEKQESEEDDNEDKSANTWPVRYYGEGELHMMFNDENANACLIM